MTGRLPADLPVLTVNDPKRQHQREFVCSDPFPPFDVTVCLSSVWIDRQFFLPLMTTELCFFGVRRYYTQSKWLRKAYAMLQGSLRVGCLKLCVYTRTAYAAKCKNLVASSKKPNANCLRKSRYRIQEPTRAAYANPTRMHTFHKFAYATFEGVPYFIKSFHLKRTNTSFSFDELFF